MREIPLTRGMVAIVDDEDYEWLNQWKWNAGDGKYAVRTDGFGGPTIFMHRLVLDPPDGMDTDHVNMSRMDNRRENLRACTRSQNVVHSPPSRASTTGFKGVHFRKDRKKYQAHISEAGKKVFLGFHKTAEEAAKAYDTAARKIYGSFAWLNFPTITTP